jgi:hypothetical protein
VQREHRRALSVLGDVHAQAVGEVDVAVGDTRQLGRIHASCLPILGLTVRPDRLKTAAKHADARNVLWLIGIASVWSFVCVVVVSLCVMARRGDEALAARPVAAEPEVGFVLGFAPPAQEPVAAPVAPRTAAQITTR